MVDESHSWLMCDGCCQAYTSSLDGTIRLWDLGTGSCKHLWKVDFPIESLVVTGSRDEDETAHVCCHWGEHGSARVSDMQPA